ARRVAALPRVPGRGDRRAAVGGGDARVVGHGRAGDAGDLPGARAREVTAARKGSDPFLAPQPPTSDAAAPCALSNAQRKFSGSGTASEPAKPPLSPLS